METVPGLDDAAHVRIDDAVFKFFEDEPIHETLRTLSTLLATIVEILENSEGRLDPKYMRITHAKALLGNCPELVDKLKVAWKDGTFREIRNLSV